VPRSQGFARGDFDTSFPIDDKFLALRHAVTPARYYAAAGVYWHVVAAAWREAERKPASRVCPDAETEIADLLSVKLLDSDERLSNRAFLAYVGRAKRQRMKTSERQRQHRTEMSRVSHGVSRVTERDAALVTVSHNPARVQGEEGSSNQSSIGDARDHDPADTYFRLVGHWPSPKAVEWVDGMTAEFGAEAVNRGMAAAFIADGNTRTLLGRVSNQLKADARQLTLKERAAEQKKLAEQRARPRVLEPWQEEFRAAIEAQYGGAA